MHSLRIACPLTCLLLSIAAPVDAQEAPVDAQEAPVDAQEDDGSHLSSDPRVNEARTLIAKEEFAEALSILRPLSPDRLDAPEQVDILFLIGLAAVGVAQTPEMPEPEKREYLDEAIGAFHRILVDQPELVRVRLELARAFYLKRDDGLSRRNFERVLAENPPPAMAANIRRFLSIMRQRRRWSGYFGMTLAPDTNVNASSDDDIIYIYNLPFRRGEDSGARSGLGVSLWGGGEYELPLSPKVRLRTGGSISRTEYEGREFDRTSLSAHMGPRWLAGSQTEISLLGSARRWWSAGDPQARELGARFEASHFLSRRFLVRTQASYHQRKFDEDINLNGPRSNFSLTGLWQATPIMRLEATLGFNREKTELERYKNTGKVVGLGTSIDLPRGFTVGLDGELRWTSYEGNWFPFTTSGEPRKDRARTVSLSVYNRAFTLKGFSPKLVLTREIRRSNAQLHDYRRTRAELQFVRVL